MAKGYWIFHVTVKDPDAYKKFLAEDKAAFTKYGARILARGGRSSIVEGSARERHVIIEFDSYDTALACYRSPEYQGVIKARQALADADIVIVEGLD